MRNDPALFRAAQSGDLRARNALVVENLPLIRILAGHYCQPTAPLFPDLVQVGCLACMRAIETFDPEIGAFGTYLRQWCRSEMIRLWRASRRCVQLAEKFQPANLERAISAGEHVDLNRLRLAALDAPARLDAPYCGDGSPYGDTLPAACQAPDDGACESEVQRAIDRLRPRDRYVLRRTMRGLTLADIARELGISRERTRQINDRAIRTLRERLNGFNQKETSNG